MAPYRKDMEEEVADALVNELHSQTKQTFEKVVETDWRLTQHNFLVNAGVLPLFLPTSALPLAQSLLFGLWSVS